jgi:hypothetical protein
VLPLPQHGGIAGAYEAFGNILRNTAAIANQVSRLKDPVSGLNRIDAGPLFGAGYPAPAPQRGGAISRTIDDGRRQKGGTPETLLTNPMTQSFVCTTLQNIDTNLRTLQVWLLNADKDSPKTSLGQNQQEDLSISKTIDQMKMIGGKPDATFWDRVWKDMVHKVPKIAEHTAKIAPFFEVYRREHDHAPREHTPHERSPSPQGRYPTGTAKRDVRTGWGR